MVIFVSFTYGLAVLIIVYTEHCTHLKIKTTVILPNLPQTQIWAYTPPVSCQLETCSVSRVLQCVACFDLHGSANQLLLEKLSPTQVEWIFFIVYVHICIIYIWRKILHKHCLLSVLVDDPSVKFRGKTYFVTKLHSCGFRDEFTVQGVYTDRNVYFTSCDTHARTHHVMACRCQWVKEHVFLPEIPPSNVLSGCAAYDKPITRGQPDARGWKTCDICDPASAVMHSSEDAHDRNACSAQTPLASLWCLS